MSGGRTRSLAPRTKRKRPSPMIAKTSLPRGKLSPQSLAKRREELRMGAVVETLPAYPELSLGDTSSRLLPPQLPEPLASRGLAD